MLESNRLRKSDEGYQKHTNMLNYAAYCDKNNFIRKINIESRLNNGGFYEKMFHTSNAYK